jgi:hypothetical protein
MHVAVDASRCARVELEVEVEEEEVGGMVDGANQPRDCQVAVRPREHHEVNYAGIVRVVLVRDSHVLQPVRVDPRADAEASLVEGEA